MSTNISYDTTNQSSFNTLDRELSVRINHPNKELSINNNLNTNFREMSIQSNTIRSNNLNRQHTYVENLEESSRPITKQNTSQNSIKQNTSQNSTKSFQTPISTIGLNLKKNTKQVPKSAIDRPQPSNNLNNTNTIEKKIKYIETDSSNFADFFSKGNKLGYNYNTDQENDLRFSESTRRKTLPKSTLSAYKKSSRDTALDNISELSPNEQYIMGLVSNDSKLRPNTVTANDKMMSIGSNIVTDIAAKISKASPDYWDNTKRRNLDTATYTNNPHKIQGRGFGDINSYGVLLNGVGTATRQDNPDRKPQNVEDDRIYLTNHNYHYDKHHVTENLPCGSDTRYLNKKMI
jgi:hypothetical protein